MTVKKANIEYLGKRRLLLTHHTPSHLYTVPPTPRNQCQDSLLNSPFHREWVDIVWKSFLVWQIVGTKKTCFNFLLWKRRMDICDWKYYFLFFVVVILEELSPVSFCADGSSEGPLLNKMMGVNMHEMGVDKVWAVDGLELGDSRQVEATWVELPEQKEETLLLVVIFINLCPVICHLTFSLLSSTFHHEKSSAKFLTDALGSRFPFG